MTSTFEHRCPSGGPIDRHLIALDIDGTLMTWGGVISPSVVRAIEQVRHGQHHVILATGRNILATMPVARELGIDRGWAVCSNGAVTVRLDPAAEDGYEIANTVTFNPRAALEVIRDEMPEAFFAVEERGMSFRVSQEFPMGELVGHQRVVGSFEELSQGEATRVVIRAPGADVSHFEDVVHRIGLSDVTYAVGYSAWLDLTPPQVSKASALECLRGQLGVDLAHTVAAGDGNNDIEMLRWAAHSAAMGSAPTPVRAAATEVVGSVDDDGILTVLARILDPVPMPAASCGCHGNH